MYSQFMMHGQKNIKKEVCFVGRQFTYELKSVMVTH